MLYKKTRRPKLVYKRKATDILYEKMMFYHEKAGLITTTLIDIITKGAQARGDLIVQLHKDLHRFNDIVIECASKLAPYQSPKLETIEVNKKVTHRFVVAAPKVINDKSQWLEKVQEEQKLLLNNSKNIINADYKVVN